MITCVNHGLMNLAKDLKKSVPLLDDGCRLMIRVRSFFAVSAKRVTLYKRWCVSHKQEFKMIPAKFETRFYKHFGKAVEIFNNAMASFITFFKWYWETYGEKDGCKVDVDEEEDKSPKVLEILNIIKLDTQTDHHIGKPYPSVHDL